MEKDVHLKDGDQAQQSKKSKRERTDAALNEITEKIMANKRRRGEEAQELIDKYLVPMSGIPIDEDEEPAQSGRAKYSRAAKPKSMTGKSKANEYDWSGRIDKEIPEHIVKPEEFKLIGREAQVRKIIRMLSQPEGGMDRFL